jgi:cell division protein FtsB
LSRKHKIIFGFGVAAVLSFFLLLVFGDDALLDLNRVENERNTLIKKNEEIARENNDMYTEIERLKHDPEYIESIARKELGMVGKDEIIFKVENKSTK